VAAAAPWPVLRKYDVGVSAVFREGIESLNVRAEEEPPDMGVMEML